MLTVVGNVYHFGFNLLARSHSLIRTKIDEAHGDVMLCSLSRSVGRDDGTSQGGRQSGSNSSCG